MNTLNASNSSVNFIGVTQIRLSEARRNQLMEAKSC